MSRVLLPYLRDRAGFIALYYLNTLVILALAALLLWFYRGPATLAELAYGLALATGLLAVYLAVDLARWLPAVRQARRLLEDDVDLEALANLPPAPSEEGALFRALADKLYRLAVAQQQRHQDAHHRHLAFMNLWVHQMKTPVTAIKAVAQDAADTAPPEVRAALDSIDEEAARLADGLELVLNTARLQEFAADYRIEPVDLLDLVRKVIIGRRRQFMRAGILPEVLAATDADWRVLTDQKWCGFVVDQVISNALKYGAQAGRPDQRLRIALTRQGPEVALTIADQGPGIPPEDLPRVCEPFFTGENGRRFGGATGIGLYLVRQILDRLEHGLHIASTPGQGTAVTVTFRR